MRARTDPESKKNRSKNVSKNRCQQKSIKNRLGREKRAADDPRPPGSEGENGTKLVPEADRISMPS